MIYINIQNTSERGDVQKEGNYSNYLLDIKITSTEPNIQQN